jgi:hypothetical protein
LHIAELSGKSNRQLGKYPLRSATRRTARPCVHVRAPYYPSLFLPSFIASRAAGNNPLPPNAIDRNIVIGGEFHIFLLAKSSGNGKYIGRPISADATGQGGNPARDASRSLKDFPNSPIARVAARYQTVTETQSPAAVENKFGQNSQSREK